MSINYYKLIDAYINGSLSEDEARAFDLACDKDKVLASTLQKRFKERLKQTLVNNEDDAQTFVSRQSRVTRRKSISFPIGRVLVLLLLIILLLFIGSIWYQSNTDIDCAELYDKHFEVYSFDTSQASVYEWKNAINLYQDSFYNSSIVATEKLLNTTTFTQKEEGIVLISACFLALKQPKIALQRLALIQKESLLYDQANYYKAMAYLQLDNWQKAKQYWHFE